jgi:hypothetical protein
MGYRGMVFLTLDGFTGSKTEMIEEGFIHYRAFEIVVSPHSFDQIQLLDLRTFAIHKM